MVFLLFTMDKVGCEVICKSHSARSERDQYRICPTKLSKSDLENLYYALLENNLQFKKTINEQQDRIKILSTKNQRLTSAQNALRSEENKNCCVATKAVVNQQKDIIAELNRTNDRMADRIRKLNMRLCSAKQFCKSATPRSLRSTTATSPYLIKHSPCSYKQQSHSTLKLAVSCHNLSRDSLVTKYVQTEDSPEFENKQKLCKDNKCKTHIEELNEKIIYLQQTLSQTKEDCNSRVSATQAELQRSRAELVSSAHELQRVEQKNTLLSSSLRAAEGLACELKLQLSIESRRVAELQTSLKAATISNRVSKSIEDTLNSMQESHKPSNMDITVTCTCSSPRSKLESSSQQAGLSPKDISSEVMKLSKSTDDSGYTDTSNKSQNLLDDQSLNKIIEELTKRIVVLQSQVDALTISPPDKEIYKKSTLDNKPMSEDRSYKTPHGIEDNDEHNISNNTQQQIELNQDINKEIQPSHIEINIEGTSYSERQHTNEQNTELSYSSTPKFKENSHLKRSLTKIKMFTNKMRHNTEQNNSTIEQSLEDNVQTQEYLERNKYNDIYIKDVIENKNKSTKETLKPVEYKDQNLKDITLTTEYNISNENIPKIIVKNTVTTEKDLKRDKENKNYDSQKKDDLVSPKRLVKHAVIKEMYREEKGKSRIWKSFLNANEQSSVEKVRTLTRTQTVAPNISSCEEATYTVEYEKSRASSPDNTDYEISSMTDHTEDKDVKSPVKSRLSPGQRRYRTSRSDSYTTPSFNYSLSEGEVPVTNVRRRSYDDKARTEHGEVRSAPKMEETLQAIAEELARCKHLLHSQNPFDNPRPRLSIGSLEAQ